MTLTENKAESIVDANIGCSKLFFNINCNVLEAFLFVELSTKEALEKHSNIKKEGETLKKGTS